MREPPSSIPFQYSEALELYYQVVKLNTLCVPAIFFYFFEVSVHFMFLYFYHNSSEFSLTGSREVAVRSYMVRIMIHVYPAM